MAVTLLAQISNLTAIGKSLLLSNKTQIADLFIDATHMETIEYSNQITDHPVERGFDIGGGSTVSDHIYKNALKLRVRGSIMDSPVDIVGSFKSITGLLQGDVVNNLVDRFKGKSRKEITAYQILTDIRDNRVLIDVVTYLDVFRNMVIESLTFPRDEGVGQRLLFEVVLKQITLATVKLITISNNPQPVQDLITNKVKLGVQETKEPTPAQQQAVKSSLPIALGRTVKNFFSGS